MFWEEKIDHLKKQFSDTEFKVPFTSWTKILKEIEKRFISKENTNQHFNNWQATSKTIISLQPLIL